MKAGMLSRSSQQQLAKSQAVTAFGTNTVLTGTSQEQQTGLDAHLGH